jgi:hypothetical protein
MKRCFREEGDRDEQTVHCSRVLAILEGEKKVLAGTHRFHYAPVRSADHSHRRQRSRAVYLCLVLTEPINGLEKLFFDNKDEILLK